MAVPGVVPGPVAFDRLDYPDGTAITTASTRDVPTSNTSRGRSDAMMLSTLRLSL